MSDAQDSLSRDAQSQWLSQHLGCLTNSPIASWVFEPETMRLLWGNQAAVYLWQAKSVADLQSRDLSKAPAHVLTRIQTLVARLRSAETVVEQWTLYPHGVPTPIQLYLAPIYLPDGRLVALSHGISSSIDPFLLRGAEVLRHTNILVALIDSGGQILIRNAAAEALFVARSTWFDWFTDSAAIQALMAQAFSGERVYREMWAETAVGRRCLGVDLSAVLDPISGQRVLLAHHTDVTDRVKALAELKRTLAVIQDQRSQILSLSAPIIDLGNSIVAVPIIGPLDTERSTEIARRLLPAVVERRAKRVILDLTGSIVSDIQGSPGLPRILRALQLIGSKPALSGLSPDLARHLVESEIGELGIPAFPTLARALAFFATTDSARGKSLTPSLEE